VYYENGQKDNCSKCNKKVGFVKSIIAALVFAVCFFGGNVVYNDLDNRIVTNRVTTSMNAKHISIELRIQRNILDNISIWSKSVENRLGSMNSLHQEQTRMLKSTIDRLRKETNEILAAQKKLQKDLGSGKLADKEVGLAIAVLTQRANTTEEQLNVLLRDPQELIDKVIKPTVAIAVRNKHGDRVRGSGVLFRKEKFVDKKTGLTKYRYYGFTAYHVWESVFKYLENIKNPDPDPIIFPDGTVFQPKIDRTLNPKLLLHYFDGNSVSPTLLITNAKFLYPNKPLHSKWKPIRDMAVFMFETYRKDLAIAELASDAEIREHVKYGSRIYTTGIAIGGAPSLYFGTTASPRIKSPAGIYFNAFGYFGQSGGPIYDAKTLKVISINQRILVHSGFSPLSNTLFGTLLTDIRRVWGLTAPKQHKKLLNP
jgi:hypothetical protein